MYQVVVVQLVHMMVRVVCGTPIPATRSYDYESTDLVVDVSSSLSFWLDGGYPNEGFIIKHESQKENNDIDYGQLKFFSKETHTIYQPKIRIGWDDSRYELVHYKRYQKNTKYH